MWDCILTLGLQAFPFSMPLSIINALPAHGCISRLLLLLVAVVEVVEVVAVGCGTSRGACAGSRGARAGIRSASASSPVFQLEVTPCVVVCPLCFAFDMRNFCVQDGDIDSLCAMFRANPAC